ncbi:integrase arm-type DNA-binding domain-containing protein [Spongiibacter marinus]|uniref:integrase arm-type DNA-binding domain-containing protein n=1 Tax=Spongiibacter marinus TaxID=354246 RepID=UPI000485EF9D|nr:integrase arm-type DNA-binding domain-containing protein [Spongiibacter marinus]
MAAREAITTTKLKKFLSGPAPEKDQYLRAPDGFGVRRFKESGKASFIVEAKVRGQGKARRVTIGPAEPELLGEAKDKARVIVARLRSGEDVTATEKAKQSEAVSQRVTIKTALDCMLEQRQGELKPETLRFYKSTIKPHNLKQYFKLTQSPQRYGVLSASHAVGLTDKLDDSSGY